MLVGAASQGRDEGGAGPGVAAQVGAAETSVPGVRSEFECHLMTVAQPARQHCSQRSRPCWRVRGRSGADWYAVESV